MAEDDLKITVLPQQFSIDVMLEKYAKGDETRIEDIYRRVARGVALAEPEARRKQVETEFFEKVRPTSLIKRFATPEEVASLVAYIASPLASATTGAALRVDGGVIKSAF